MRALALSARHDSPRATKPDHAATKMAALAAKSGYRTRSERKVGSMPPGTFSQMRPAMLLALGTWSLMLLLNVTLYALAIGVPSIDYLASSIAIIILGVLFSAALFLIARMVGQWPPLLRWPTLGLAVVALAALLAVVDAFGALQIAAMDTAAEARRLPPLLQAVNNFAIMVWQFGLLAAAYAMLETNRLAHERERDLAEARQTALEAARAATAARLEALRYQLNPHFLFNTLNAISSLVVTKRNELAETMLSRLSDFLRATLAGGTDTVVSLDAELATLQTYLEVEALRFADRLIIDVDCPPSLREAIVPGFILQPLVENAIKYAVVPAKQPVTIAIIATEEDGDLVLQVRDDGDGDDDIRRSDQPRTGVGHANVRERLRVLYGPAASFSVEALKPGYRAVLRLPLSRAQRGQGAGA